MRIPSVNTYNKPSFKAHFYDGYLNNNYLVLNKIITDNNPNLGSNPELIITDGNGYEDCRIISLEKAKPIPMHKIEANHFAANAHCFIKGYKIVYKDTGLVDDNNGKNYDLTKFEDLTYKAIAASKVSHNHPLTSIISAGEVSGMLVMCDDVSKLPEDFDKETPTILLSKYNKDYNPYLIPKNVVGIIFEQGSAGYLYHVSTEARNLIKAVAITYDEKEIKRLEDLNNQFIKFSTLDKKMSFNRIDELDSVNPKSRVSIKIPEMQYIDTLVDSKDYELNTVGSKAYNLKIMQELADNEILDGVQIPRSFAVTHGFIDKMLDEAKTTGKRSPSFDSPYIKEIENKIKDYEFNEKKLMLRSSFNGEDIENYSASGLYASKLCSIEDLPYGLMDVVRSKNSPKAVSSRKMYGISDEIIKPTVIVQERICPDYAFTIYTKDPTENEDILTINMNTSYTSESKDPYILQYNKKDKTLKIQSLERDVEYFRFDEQGNIVSNSCSEDKLLNSWDETKPTLEKVVKNALALENYFGTAQDIEGGIKGEDIYFWQTRNIVNN